MVLLSFIIHAQSANDVLSELSEFEKADQPEVMVLGTFHFNEYKNDNSGNTFTGTPPDVLSTERQKELSEFRNLLETFKPTKICVEWKRDKQDALNEEYSSFTSSKETKERGETYQIAFKLASKMGHDKIYAVDAYNDWFMDSLVNYAFTIGQGDFFMKAQKLMPQYIQSHYDEMEGMTIEEIFLDMNSGKSLLFNHQLHQSFCKTGQDEVYLGTDLYANWMNRNMRIYTNITRIAEPNDKILVLYGASHVHSIKQMIEDDFELNLVELSQIKGE